MAPLPTFDTFRERLVWWIDRRGFSQKEAARRAGMSQPSLSEICNGRSKNPSAENFLRLAIALELRPEYLLWGEGPAEATNFAQLTGLEAQLVMLFRGLPDDTKRDALLIDVNHAYNKSSSGKPSAADPFGGATPPAPPKAAKPAAKAPKAPAAKPPATKKPKQHA